jgi:hypothetical protein
VELCVSLSAIASNASLKLRGKKENI